MQATAWSSSSTISTSWPKRTGSSTWVRKAGPAAAASSPRACRMRSQPSPIKATLRAFSAGSWRSARSPDARLDAFATVSAAASGDGAGGCCTLHGDRRMHVAVDGPRGRNRAQLADRVGMRRHWDVLADLGIGRIPLSALSRRGWPLRLEQARLWAVRRVHDRLDLLERHTGVLAERPLLHRR